MTTISRCFTPVIGKLMRVTALNHDGTLPTSMTADKVLVSDGFVEINLTAEIEAGAEIVQKNSAGALCVNERQPSSFKRFTADIMFCGVNPFLLTMLTGALVYLNAAGAVIGFAQPEGEITNKFALEVWTGLSGSKTASGYFLLPLLNGGTIDTLKIDGKSTIDFTAKGTYTQGGNSWGTGRDMVIDGAGTNAVQTITVTGTPTGGTFTLNFDGATTTTILYNSTAAQLQAILDALPTIGTGNTLVAGGALPGTPLTVTFRNTLGGAPQPLMTLITNSLTGGSTPTVTPTTTTPGVAGVAALLPSAVDPFDHMLCLVTDIAAPSPSCSPVPIS
jgi:hypothetical protein